MARSMFDIVCPACGGDLELSGPGNGRCTSCGAGYLVRIGHLIPIGAPSGGSPASPTHGRGVGR